MCVRRHPQEVGVCDLVLLHRGPHRTTWAGRYVRWTDPPKKPHER
jgi:hypothetical protein